MTWFISKPTSAEDSEAPPAGIMSGGSVSRRAGSREADRSSRYIPELDGVRGLAVLAIVAVHAGFPRSRGGVLGVDIFFVVSGFLIASILIREHQTRGQISLRNFYARRALRLLPALVVLLLVCLAYGLFFPGATQGRETVEAVPLSFFYVANLFRALHLHELGLLEHTWSLSIEEQFYLCVAPLLMFMLAHRVRLGALAVTFLAGAAFMATHRAMVWGSGGSFERIYFGSDTRMDGLLIGVALAAIVSTGVVPRSRRTRSAVQATSIMSMAMLAVLMVTTDLRQPAFYFNGGFFLVSLLVAIVVYQIFTAPIRAVSTALTMRWLVVVGRMSYGVYLWHLPILRFFHVSNLVAEPALTAVRIGATLGVATLSFHYVEQPFLRMKHRFNTAPRYRPESDQAGVNVVTGR